MSRRIWLYLIGYNCSRTRTQRDGKSDKWVCFPGGSLVGYMLLRPVRSGPAVSQPCAKLGRCADHCSLNECTDERRPAGVAVLLSISLAGLERLTRPLLMLNWLPSSQLQLLAILNTAAGRCRGPPGPKHTCRWHEGVVSNKQDSLEYYYPVIATTRDVRPCYRPRTKQREARWPCFRKAPSYENVYPPE